MKVYPGINITEITLHYIIITYNPWGELQFTLFCERKINFRKMEAKKNSRITIKSVKEELNKEINYLKVWMKTLENRLNISERKVSNLEDKLSKMKNVTENDSKVDSKNEVKCETCEKMCPSKKDLKVHMRESHPRILHCTICLEMFEQSSDLELHLKENHSSPKFKCDQCDKAFVLKWRLKKSTKLKSCFNHC